MIFQIVTTSRGYDAAENSTALNPRDAYQLQLHQLLHRRCTYLPASVSAPAIRTTFALKYLITVRHTAQYLQLLFRQFHV